MNKPPESTANKSRITLEFIKKHLIQNAVDEADDHDNTASENLGDAQELENNNRIEFKQKIERLKKIEREQADEGKHERQTKITHLGDLQRIRYAQDTRLRNKYAARVYWFMVCYTIFMAGVVVASGLQTSPKVGDEPLFFRLADLPLSTLIGGAFASAVGLVAFVVKGLFPHDHKESKS